MGAKTATLEDIENVIRGQIVYIVRDCEEAIIGVYASVFDARKREESEGFCSVTKARIE